MFHLFESDIRLERLGDYLWIIDEGVLLVNTVTVAPSALLIVSREMFYL